jgi:DNA-binding MarR family transcriptional regulator
MVGKAAAEHAPDGVDLTWARMLSLFVERRDAIFDALTAHGLTPPHAHALTVLAEAPVRMRDLADQMMCDASYITSIVDRLEEAGLAERRLNATDRRVKEVALTAKGRRVALKLRATMTQPPTQFAKLTRAERTQLAAVLERLVPDVSGLPDPFRPTPKANP